MDRRCARARGHRGPHASHGTFGRLLAVWEPRRAELQPSAEARARVVRSASRGHRGTGGADDPGVPYRMTRRVLKTVSSPEQLGLVVLFLGLVAWGVSVAIRIVSAW
ncbi:MAG: hypothetical protein P8188_00225 [Gemmatimonadota bacterium]